MEMEVAASPKARVLAFLKAYENAPNDADVEIRTGKSEDGDPAIMVSIGSDNHALFAWEARKIADIMERVLNENPDNPETEALPNIILALRAGADAAVSHS